MSDILFNLPPAPMELGIEVAREARDPKFTDQVMAELAAEPGYAVYHDALTSLASELAPGDPEKVKQLLHLGYTGLVLANRGATFQQVEAQFTETEFGIPTNEQVTESSRPKAKRFRLFHYIARQSRAA